MSNDQRPQENLIRKVERPLLPSSQECARLPGMKAEERRLAAQHAAWTEKLEAKQDEARRISAEPPSPKRERRHQAVLLEIEGINQKRMEAGNRQKEVFDEIGELESSCRGMA